MNNLRITTAELARLCSVSQGTVDRALNNRSGIKAETKERILKTAAQYGFRGAVGNSKCADERTRQIGVIVFNLNNEYFCKLITEIEAACREKGYTTLIMFTNYDKQHEIECVRRMYSLGVEGIILCAVNSGPEFEKYLKAFDIPIVAVGNDIRSVPYIGVDDYAAMKEMTEYVLGGGLEAAERRCNMIYFSPAIQYEDAYAQKRRFEGFLAALPLGQPYSVITDIDKIREEYPQGTVILCSNDYYALKVHFKTKGAVITGFDNIDILDKYRIPISSVAYSIEEIAGKALDCIVNKSCESQTIAHYFVKRV